MNRSVNKKTQKKPVLVLDAGKVLVDFDYDRFFRKFAALYGIELSLPLTPELDALCKGLERGEYTWEVFTGEISRIYSVSIDPDTFRRVWNDIFTGEIPGMQAELASLKNDFSLVAMSNTSEVHWSFVVETYPVFRLFDGWVVSFTERCMKPDPELYRIVMERFCGDEPPFYYTDDSLEFVSAARGMSWEAEVFVNAGQFRMEVEKRRDKR